MVLCESAMRCFVIVVSFVMLVPESAVAARFEVVWRVKSEFLGVSHVVNGKQRTSSP